MKYYFNLLILALLLGSSGGLFAQDLEHFKALFSKTENYYKNTAEYSLKVSYQFFEIGKNGRALESLAGKIRKKENNYYSKIDQTEFIYIDQTFLKINHQQKAVLYAPIADPKTVTPVEVTALLEYFDRVDICEDQAATVCELHFKTNKTIPYEKMVLHLDPKSHAIRKQELYMLPGKTYPGQANREKTKAGKVVITLLPEAIPKNGDQIFERSNYLLSSTTPRLSKKLSAYKLYNTNQ